MFESLTSRPDRRAAAPAANPWHALWAMMVGFFMILVDATIVAVANPALMAGLGAGYDTVIWVTSAYLLAYAVPLLVAGRLGDRFGPKNLYLLGLTVFTAASLWCGLADSIGMLIGARVVQGVGAALLTPQTLSTITRTFPAERRGVAMSVWGATAGVATLVGPLAGGFLVDGLGWQWIFFVNVPIGVLGVALAVRLVPALPTSKKGFDLPGVVLSGVGMFMVVFALQEGQSHDWAPWVWGTTAGGIGFLAAFVIWQSVNTNEPLVPLVIFRDRDFSLSALGVATIGFVVTAMIVPVMFYAQAVCGLSPTRSALLTAPMAIATGALAPFVGRIVDRSHPRPVVGFGFAVLAVALTWLSVELTPTTPMWRIVLPLTATGVGMAFIWSPLAATATRRLPGRLAGAGSGVYNSTRQVGSVLGSAALAAFMTWRISAEMPPVLADTPAGEGAVGRLPAYLHDSFSAAMSQTLLLPAFFALFGVIAALFLVGSSDRGRSEAIDDELDEGDFDARRPNASYDNDTFLEEVDDIDDDAYVEYTVHWDEPEPRTRRPVVAVEDDADTEPLRARHEQLAHAPGNARRWEPRPATHAPTESEPAPARRPTPAPNAEHDHESWRSILDQLLADVPPAKPTAEPVGFAHNGFHVDDEHRIQPVRHPDRLAEPRSSEAETYSADIPFGADEPDGPSRHRGRGGHEAQEPRPFWFQSNGRHSRDDPDASRSGRHSLPWRD
ncbi:MFS transporter [Mycobacterium deserti]|uniref:DHA2 family efflux MFS transporter permease subunit n=1 Tax=Mycobacterium deserti TaxID=2978347 RepID=A0ABT2M3U1_9MYCO|nr:DHA2 family efflux MFS transporter permease subunit [Mycobacterium deserti]MCT7656924.1 DHA2 family efflux MFS transporter permease subunit [Mycobacterium deserti]